jgi:hypothetical protein
MYATKIGISSQPTTRSELTAKERRLVCRLITADPESLRRIKGDPRLDRLARELIEAYREEMIDDLRQRIEPKGNRPERMECPRLPQSGGPVRQRVSVPA